MLRYLSKKINVAVHDGKFHPDDVFSVAILSMYLDKPIKVYRTRDPGILSKMDYVLDVGRIYSPKDNKFDHHQEGWDEKRTNGILYATSGLLWKEYGEQITGSKQLASKIDEKIIQTIDADDNAIETYQNIVRGVTPYTVVDYIYSLNLTWTEKKSDPLKFFMMGVDIATKVLKREIKKSEDSLLGKKKVLEIYKKTKDKRILILDDDYTWKKTVSELEEPLFVIKKYTDTDKWSIKSVPVAGHKFKSRIEFPKTWAGKEGEELIKVSGVFDAIFCHNGRFMCLAKSEKGAIELAKAAIAISQKSVKS